METKERHETEDILTGWGKSLQAAVCEKCDWQYLLPSGEALPRCPHCFGAQLTLLGESLEGLPYLRPPELIIPFALSAELLAQRVAAFAQGIPFCPPDLSYQALRSRLRPLYLPVWLVDTEVAATWQGEAGFDYEVVSHQDRFDDGGGGWVSQQVKEGRIRWEPRVGRLQRLYPNILSPAIEGDAVLKRHLGRYDMKAALPYTPELLKQEWVRRPDRSPEAAWADAEPAVRTAALEECRTAAGADHFREFHWTPEYAQRTWTLFLLPVYTTYYLDDEQHPQPVLIHGQTGVISGVRRASMRRARQVALIIGAVALFLFLLSLVLMGVGVVVPPGAVLGGLGIAAAVVVGWGAAIPVLWAWYFNTTDSEAAQGEVKR